MLLLENIVGIADFDHAEPTTVNTMINLKNEMLLNWEIIELEEDKTIWQNFENKEKSSEKK